MTGRAYLFGRVSQKRAQGSVDRNSPENLGQKGVARFKGRVSGARGVGGACVCVRVRACACATGSSAGSKATIALKANSHPPSEEETGVSVAQWGIPSKGWDLVCQNCGSGLPGGGFHPSI